MAFVDKAATILVLEDHDEIRQLLQEYFESRGFRCLAAQSVDAAHSLMAGGPVDAGIIDLMMPVTPGSVVATELMSAGIPIIVLTGLSRDTAASHVPDGAIILEKPVDLRVLDAALREQIRAV
ncbi:MAG: response regulator [Bacillota bacterium]|nr:response regulator [Bacillota bacterium]